MGVRRFLRAAGDVVLPRRCVVCGCRLLMAEEFICLGCLMDMPLTRYWERARNPMADRFNEKIQRRLEGFENVSERTDYEHYSYAAALFFYHSEADYRHIPYQIKYHGNIALGKHFGRMLGQKLADGGRRDSVWEDVDMVVPVPLHWTRRWKRGYNQAEVIAEALAEILGVPMRTDILQRQKRTKTQVKVSVEEKERNVSGAFAVTEAAQRELEGVANGSIKEVRHILLVDDVFTTGSTLEACHNALRTVFPLSVRISAVTLGYLER